MPATRGVPLAPIRFRWEGDLRRTPPLATAPAVLRLRGRQAPADRDFRGWATDHTDARTAQILSAAAGVYTFHHDPESSRPSSSGAAPSGRSSTRRHRRAT